MSNEAGEHGGADRGAEKTDFTVRPVTLKDLKKLAAEGKLRRRKRRSKYRTFLESFKRSEYPAEEVKGLTSSQVSQVLAAVPQVFGSGNLTTKTLETSGEGRDTKFDILLIKKTDVTQEILSAARMYSGSKSNVTVVRPEARSKTSRES